MNGRRDLPTANCGSPEFKPSKSVHAWQTGWLETLPHFVHKPANANGTERNRDTEPNFDAMQPDELENFYETYFTKQQWSLLKGNL